MKIQIEESALDSMKAMVKKLQEERDILLSATKGMIREFGYEVIRPIGMVHAEHEAIRFACNAISKCTESTKVMQ